MESNDSLFSLTIDPLTKKHLSETAKWARFLAILGIVLLIVFLLATLMGTTLLTTFTYRLGGSEVSNEAVPNQMRITMIISAVITVAIAFFPLLFLLRFSNAMRSAIRANDQNKLNLSFQNLKIYFRYLGIIAVIGLIFYGLIVAIALIGAAATH